MKNSVISIIYCDLYQDVINTQSIIDELNAYFVNGMDFTTELINIVLIINGLCMLPVLFRRFNSGIKANIAQIKHQL